MCEFISWIEKNNEILFLDYHDIYETKRGKELREFCVNPDDLVGHGAIRHYYSIVGGKERECTDFSSPKNFPPKIVAAIKAGKFAGLGVSEQLLNEPALAEYQKIQQPAWAEYQKIKQSAFWKLFSVKKNRNPLWK